MRHHDLRAEPARPGGTDLPGPLALQGRAPQSLPGEEQGEDSDGPTLRRRRGGHVRGRLASTWNAGDSGVLVSG